MKYHIYEGTEAFLKGTFKFWIRMRIYISNTDPDQGSQAQKQCGSGPTTLRISWSGTSKIFKDISSLFSHFDLQVR
jgi:hypothetical protein